MVGSCFVIPGSFFGVMVISRKIFEDVIFLCFFPTIFSNIYFYNQTSLIKTFFFLSCLTFRLNVVLEEVFSTGLCTELDCGVTPGVPT